MNNRYTQVGEGRSEPVSGADVELKNREPPPWLQGTYEAERGEPRPLAVCAHANSGLHVPPAHWPRRAMTTEPGFVS